MKFYSYSKYLISSLIMVACCLQQCVWGQSSTVRPYKFGFTIEEQQHRREMRDERGIVMGEFGFITADGIYHVTVYATDEQGRFRILAMKNYPYESPTKTVEVMVQPKSPPTTTTTKPLPKKNFNTQACAGCSIGNGNNKSKGLNGIDEKPTKGAARAATKSSSSPSDSQLPGKSGSTASKPAAQGSSSSLEPTKPDNGNPPPIMDIIMQKVLPAIMDEESRTAGSSPKLSTTLNSKSDVPFGQPQPSGNAAFDASGGLGGSSVSSANNDAGDLYRFKYILDYHGHTETGKRNGNKEGSYFAIGDDNVERTIQYVANELGYQPRVRWRKLDSNEIKSKENTLKDYEFIWFTK